MGGVATEVTEQRHGGSAGLIEDLGVDAGDPDVTVAEDLADRLDRGAPVEHQCGGRVAKTVGGHLEAD